MNNEIKNQILLIVNEVNDGYVDPLKAYMELKELEEIISISMKSIKDQAMDEARKYGKKSFQFHNAEITLKNGASRYDFSHIQSYQQQKEKLKYIEELAKIGGGVIEETGEIIEKAKKIEGAETIMISFKNKK
jgi:hypothetical protein